MAQFNTEEGPAKPRGIYLPWCGVVLTLDSIIKVVDVMC
jgi:hypothetical protein